MKSGLTLFGVVAIVGLLTIPAAAVYMMVGFGAEAFARAEAVKMLNECVTVAPVNSGRTGDIG
jgi:NCAIR mutase (PurE)-related protein